MTRRAASSFSRAFTLMEVMLAMVAFAVTLAAISAVFYGALKLRERSANAIEATLPVERALAIIRNDLASLVPPGTNLFFGQLQTRPQMTNASTAIVGNTPTIAVQGTVSPDFYTSSGVVNDSTQWGEVQKVTYELAISTNGTEGLDLFRRVKRNFLPPAMEEIEQQALLSKVEALEFYYHNGTTWQDTWDSTTEAIKLPRAIKAVITLEGQSARFGPPPVELIVPIIDAGTNNLQVAGVSQ